LTFDKNGKPFYGISEMSIRFDFLITMLMLYKDWVFDFLRTVIVNLKNSHDTWAKGLLQFLIITQHWNHKTMVISATI
jgi:hypothetical protein